MPVLADSDLVDLGRATLNDLGRLKWISIAQRLQRYEVMKRILKKDRIDFQSGKGISRNAMVDESYAARQVGQYEQDSVNVPDLLNSTSMPWRHTVWHWAYERREVSMNGGAAKIVDLLKVRRAGALLSAARHMEEQFWSCPDNSSDKLDVHGIPYWIVKASTDEVGFNGGTPSGFTDVAGLDPATYTRWKNANAQFVQFTEDDCIDKILQLMHITDFQSPVDEQDYRTGNGEAMRMYTNETNCRVAGRLLRKSNDSIGDLGKYDGEAAVKRVPFRWVPYLDADTSNPIYGLNFDFFHPVFLKGDYLRESEPLRAPNQHNCYVVFTDCTWNLLCDDRRRQWVISNAA